MKWLVPIVCLSGLLLTGCVSTYKYRSYEGAQKDWPVSTGGIVDRDHVIPIYFGPPFQPYEVLGMMVANINSLGMASRNAKYHGGEAMVLVGEKTIQGGNVEFPGAHNTYSSGTSYAGSYSGNSTTYSTPSVSVPIRATFETFAVIKFKPQPAETASSATHVPASNSKSTNTNP